MPNYYTKNAPQLFEAYRATKPETIHATWYKTVLKRNPGLACDIGAGSGRDANWLASQGWEVVAVEPNDALRQLAKPNSLPNVQWLNDSLPALKHLRRLGHRFDLILMSAVWMHVSPAERAKTFRRVTELLAPGGTLVISLRLSEQDEPGREFYPVSAAELDQLANHRAIARLLEVPDEPVPDTLGRAGVSWLTRAYRLPDDGTGSLPLLRHVIVNDDKSSTYKLGLLRTLIRAADSMPGMVTKWSDDWVEIPFGLVGLFWIKLYHPLLLQHDLVQAPRRKDGSKPGYGFAREPFYALGDLSVAALRVGAVYTGDAAKAVTGAIRDACQLIRKMPAHYITYPGSDTPVFEAQYASVRQQGSLRIDKAYLQQFGSFRIPRDIWMTLSQFACWLEPAIVNEWKSLMRGWQIRYNPAVFEQAMQWEAGRRDTSQVRQLVDARRGRGEPVHCVWSAARLRQTFAVDHCFPFSYWPNNDLWNLLPTTQTANGKKSDAIPSARLMMAAQPRVLDWWGEASTGSNQEQFFIEAEAALPDCDVGAGLAGVFSALQHQRLRLLRDQRLREWAGV